MRKKFCLFLLCLMCFVTLAPVAALAAGTSGGFEFETGLQKLADSLTGPVAKSVALIGIIVGAVGAIWGAEFGQTARMLFGVILIIGILCFASPLLTTVMGVKGAMIL